VTQDLDSTQHFDDPEIYEFRRVLAFTSAVLFATALLCLFAPQFLAIQAAMLVGIVLVVSALLQCCHLLFAWLRVREPSGTRPSILGMLLLNGFLGGFLFFAPELARWWLSAIIVFAVGLEGLLLFYVSVRLVSIPSKWMMWLGGCLSLAVAILSFQNLNQPLPVIWIGYILGAKLLIVAVAFMGIAIRASNDQIRVAYTGIARRAISPEIGSIYAVYYGPAFHCGIAIDQNHVVDYLSNGIVRLITWQEFLLGRTAMEWNYPDVVPGQPEDIVRFARELVGQKTQYRAFEFNCESLAIYCRSLGKTHKSDYSQSSVGLEMLAKYPIMGGSMQIMSRGVSWFLYGVGGPFGKQFGFFLVLVSRWTANWLIVRTTSRTSES
jgi:uncharacterized membrane protein HdeD (DUF308 family)